MSKIIVWEDIPNYVGYYQVSNTGQIRALDRVVPFFNRWKGFFVNRLRKGQIMHPGVSPNGYKIVTLQKDGIKKHKTVHRIVASVFIPNPLNLPQINHKDLNKTNNNVENLEWCTASDNLKHAAQNGRISGNNQFTKKVVCLK